MNNIDTGILHDIADFQTDQPATAAELMHRIAFALEILPQPTSVYYGETYSHPYVRITVSGIADSETWRQWADAPEPTVTWETDEARHHTTQTVWRGRTITLIRVELLEKVGV